MAKQTRGAITQGTVGVTALVQSLVGKEELITLELAQDACIFVDDIQATLGTPDEIDNNHKRFTRLSWNCSLRC